MQPLSPKPNGFHHYNEGRGLPPEIFTPACQHLPGFHIVPPQTPREWNGMWFIIDF